ncbi:hypothetical protein L226DRAFT_94652 [Lentinus tigrinus ALCF2SS1-7]|uniref:Uncharacterized protein n=1 Tax=Lentinus tigrinus ALCF2SS1-6 TaxID=1328759 RepID=A0A5C2RSV1_9APHY|nr:hypothetical protein L227DRAFT_396517 [Lentinus tigrinus ALCF2SS1-6]RPD73665.1 hypothetical protein L226DRAFT_94652 [Lentinus tigrinus ALCF2SS1-7]
MAAPYGALCAIRQGPQGRMSEWNSDHAAICFCVAPPSNRREAHGRSRRAQVRTFDKARSSLLADAVTTSTGKDPNDQRCADSSGPGHVQGGVHVAIVETTVGIMTGPHPGKGRSSSGHLAKRLVDEPSERIVDRTQAVRGLRRRLHTTQRFRMEPNKQKEDSAKSVD